MLPTAVTLIEPSSVASPQRNAAHHQRSQSQLHAPDFHGATPPSSIQTLPTLDGVYPRYGATGWASQTNRELLYLFGGCDASGSPTATLQRCNVVTTEVKLMSFQKGPSARYLHATAVASGTGNTYTYGGSGTAMLLDDLWMWSASDFTWKEFVSLGNGPGRRHSHQIGCSGCGTALVVVGGSTVPPALSYQHDAGIDGMKPRDDASRELQKHLGPRLGFTSSTAALDDGFRTNNGGVWVYKLLSEVWIPVDASPQLQGRRLFSMLSIGRRGSHHAINIALGASSPRAGRHASTVAVHGVASGSFARAPSIASAATSSKISCAPVIDTFLCSPGTRSTDVPVVLRLIGGNRITETHLPISVDAAKEFSCVPASPLTPNTTNASSSIVIDGNPEQAQFADAIQPPPTCRAGSIFVPYSPIDDEPASVVDQMSRETLTPFSPGGSINSGVASSSVAPAAGKLGSFETSDRSTSLLPYTALDEVLVVRLGGTHEADLSLLSRGTPGGGSLHGRLTLSSSTSESSRVQHIGVVRAVVVPRCVDKEQECLDDCIAAYVEAVAEVSDSDDDDADDADSAGSPLLLHHMRSTDTIGSSVTTSTTGVVAVSPQDPLLPPRVLGKEWLPPRPLDAAVFPPAPLSSSAGALDTSSEALMTHLCHLSNATVINTAGTVFVFGGKSELDGRVSGALFLIQKKPLIAEVREHASSTKPRGLNAKSPTASSPLSPQRRASMRLQTILATMGSMRKRSFLSVDKKKPKCLAEDFKESVLERSQRRAKEQAVAERRELAEELVRTLLASGDIKTPEQAAAAEAALLERMESTGDGALAWDLHDHYHVMVEDLLKPIGMGSPIVGDEGVVASETAFYLRQSVTTKHAICSDDDPSKKRGGEDSRRGGAMAQGKGGGGVPHRLEDDAAVSTSGRRYHEWFHPPIVSRAEAVALEKLAQPSTKTSSSARPESATCRGSTGRVSAPLSSDTTAHRRQIRASVNREVQATMCSPRPPRPTPSFAPQAGTPASIFAQRYVSAEARMTVNAAIRRPRTASNQK
jgi:hypothetical protein